MILTGENQSTRGRTSPSATLSTTNPTWTDLGSNPYLRGGRLATNRLSHGTTQDHLHFSVGILPIFHSVALVPAKEIHPVSGKVRHAGCSDDPVRLTGRHKIL
jgi:hypothetical protein